MIHRCVCPENIYIAQNGHIFLGGLGHSVSQIEQGFLNKRVHEYPSHIEDYLNYLSPEILQQVFKITVFKFHLKKQIVAYILYKKKESNRLQLKIRYLQFGCNLMRVGQWCSSIYWM